MAQDLLLEQTSNGFFDIAIGEQDLDTVDGLETTIAVLLFTDARATPAEINNPEKRRGWVGNVLRETELGGMLWLMSQMRNDQLSRNKISNWAENSLQPLIDQGLATEIIVSFEQTKVNAMKLQIQIVVKEGVTEKFDYWLATDLGNLIDDS